jgi:hypothetical protein
VQYQWAYHPFVVIPKIVPYEGDFHFSHRPAEQYKGFPSADIADTVCHYHTSALLKHTPSKLERLL